MTVAQAILVALVSVAMLAVLRWLIEDARKRGMSGGLWVLAVLFGGVAPLFVYLAIREKLGSSRSNGRSSTRRPE